MERLAMARAARAAVWSGGCRMHLEPANGPSGAALSVDVHDEVSEAQLSVPAQAVPRLLSRFLAVLWLAVIRDAQKNRAISDDLDCVEPVGWPLRYNGYDSWIFQWDSVGLDIDAHPSCAITLIKFVSHSNI